jgi:hypothetical protein
MAAYYTKVIPRLCCLHLNLDVNFALAKNWWESYSTDNSYEMKVDKQIE